MRFLDSFILNIPYQFLKRVPYLWPVVIAFWVWPPVLFLWILIAIVLVSLLLVVWQRQAWEAKLIRDRHQGDDPVYLDRPKMPLKIILRNLVLLVLGSTLLAWLFQGNLDLSFWQWFFLAFGFTLLYMDHRLLGATTVYILTGQGLGLRNAPGHVDYRLFFSYDEIRYVQRIQVPKPMPIRWSLIAPMRNPDEGILLTPKNPSGFTRLIDGEVLLTPSDMDEFLQHTPGKLIKQGD